MEVRDQRSKRLSEQCHTGGGNIQKQRTKCGIAIPIRNFAMKNPIDWRQVLTRFKVVYEPVSIIRLKRQPHNASRHDEIIENHPIRCRETWTTQAHRYSRLLSLALQPATVLILLPTTT